MDDGGDEGDQRDLTPGDADAFAAPGDQIIYVEVTRGVFAPIRAAEAQWRAAGRAGSGAPETNDPVTGRAASDGQDPADVPGTPTRAELLDPTSSLTRAERWAGLVGAAPDMTIEEKQRAAVTLLRTGMTDDQVETALNALFPPAV